MTTSKAATHCLAQRIAYPLTVMGTFLGIGSLAFILLTLATWSTQAERARAGIQVVNPENDVVQDTRAAPPDAYRVSPALVFTTRDRVIYDRLLGRARFAPGAVIVQRRGVEVVPEEGTEPPLEIDGRADVKTGINPVDSTDADQDGYVEYYDNGHYVAELRTQKQVAENEATLTFSGTVAQLETVRYGNIETPHAVARVEAADGKHALVDLGRVDRWDARALKIGDQIAVQARLGSLNGQPLLVAQELRLGDAVITILE